jgi:hypothetical protein
MRQWQWQVREIAASGGLAQLTCAGPAVWPAPGQVCLAYAESAAQPFLRVPLHPFPDAREQPTFCVPGHHPYAQLSPGVTLDLLGPCGRGFYLPEGTQHLLILASALERILGLVHMALQRQVSITLLTPRRFEALPLAVEVTRGPLSADLVLWADVVALDVLAPLPTASKVRALVPPRPAHFVQALFHTPLPCGTGACQACWLTLNYTKRLACVDGPVLSIG